MSALRMKIIVNCVKEGMPKKQASSLATTIGRSTPTLEKFIGPLQTSGATRVVDVAKMPRSRHTPEVEPKEAPDSAAGKVHPQPPIQPVSERFPALEEQEIVLTLLAPEAREVYVAGDFNRWRPGATPLKNTGTGEWIVRLILRSGQYQYRFVVDGRWSEDPLAAQRVANSHSGFNSVLIVPLEVRTSFL